MARTPYIAANWKMNKTVAEAAEFIDALLPRIAATQHDVVVCPPFTALHEVVERRRGTAVRVAAQNMHFEASGAFTGEVSAPMLVELDVEAVVLGHSERRQFFGETDETVNKKLGAALSAGLVPIVCVGETLAEREGGQTLPVVDRQVRGALKGFAAAQLATLVIAYEPVWAIGTGKTATSAQAQEVHAMIRKLLGELLGAQTAAALRIQYGGSVKPENIAELMSKPDVDGALVGGASLKPDDFAKIVKFDSGT